MHFSDRTFCGARGAVLVPPQPGRHSGGVNGADQDFRTIPQLRRDAFGQDLLLFCLAFSGGALAYAVVRAFAEGVSGGDFWSIGLSDGLFLDCGWNYGGFKAVPASGWCMAHLMATGEPHEVARKFRLDRFATGHLLDEEGTGSQHNLH